MNLKDANAKAIRVKKNLVEEFGTADATIVGSVLDFVIVSPAKEPVYGCGCLGMPKQN